QATFRRESIDEMYVAKFLPGMDNLARDYRFCQQRLRLQDLVDEKKVCEECTEMDRSIQVIDQLRADGALGKNKLNGGERVASVTFQHSEKSEVAFGWLEVFLLHRCSISFRQT